MKLIAIAAVSLLALQGQAHGAERTVAAPSVAPPAPPAPPLPLPPLPPVSEALLERFLASLPKDAFAGPAKPDSEAVERLIESNPGKEAQIATVLGEFDKCSEPAAAAAMEKVYRMAMRSPFLNAEKVERLAAFYGAGGWASLKALNDRIDKSPAPLAADLAESKRLAAAYPLVEFAMSMQIAAFGAAQQGLFKAHEKCEADRNAALAEAGVRTPEGSAFAP